MSAMLSAALAYAARGWPVFPAPVGEKKSHKSAAHSNGRRWGMTTDADEIRRDFKKWPQANIGIPTGPVSGFFVVDVDTMDGHGKDGITALRALEASHGALPQTLTARSPTGSLHFYFLQPPGIPISSMVAVAEGIDIRADGGMVIAPPSVRPGKGKYEWQNDLPIVAAPPWLLDLITVPVDDVEQGPEPTARERAADDAARAGSDTIAKFNARFKVEALFKRFNYVQERPNSKNWRSPYQGSGSYATEILEGNRWRSLSTSDAGKGLGRSNGKSISGDSFDLFCHFTHHGDIAAALRAAERLSEGDEPNDGGTKPYVLVRASDVVPRAKRWLWEGHLARGILEMTTGLPGLGKSLMHCDLVARATTGTVWPDGTPGGPPVNVIMVVVEDTLDQDIVPRLIAAGADRKRVFILKAIRKDKKERMFLLGEDIDALEMMVADVDAALVTIDPITAYMGKVDSHRATDVRSQLGPLATLAEKMDVAVSAITHPAKAASQKAIDHFVGSQAFIAAARIGHLCAEEKDEEGNPSGRVLYAMVKTNSQKMPTLAYHREVLTVGQDPATGDTIGAARAVWEEEVDVTADQAVATEKKSDEVTKWLKQLLAHGQPVLVKEIEQRGEEAGFTMRQLRRAKTKLGKIVVAKPGFINGWTWQLDRAGGG